ncbi:hypothetical protein [Roseisolibacter sp. H3M3-2]|uniref:hypothetical protein n=1 Tax=Roseisolibacter sp. H3M3-2 TaxID=3031323 RepID=UPI0023DC7957|nr:hypothetical protein [Roseisolibacter sp. H3M3-2]MDF1501655.1 hypothetical protein [Roseisolibacter sp. H3M3-2]
MPDESHLPAKPPSLDPRAIERVLARAAALQASAPSGAVEGLSEAELLEVAREAGLSVDHVRRALAEERLRGALVPADAESEGGIAERLAGPGRASASRLIAGDAATVLARLSAWLEREECMRPVRRLADGGTWEPRRDLVGNVLRGVRGGGTPALRTARALGAAVLPLDDRRTLVTLEADVSEGRRQRLAVGAVCAASGAAASATILGVGVVANALLAVVVPVAVLPVLAGGGVTWALARGHRGAVARAALALVRVLDHLEHAPAPAPRPPTLRDVIDGVRRSLG